MDNQTPTTQKYDVDLVRAALEFAEVNVETMSAFERIVENAFKYKDLCE
jgi:hypothetical protein